ncbi:unnamed protein product [Parnassius mnemosyne]|uniref:Uncharacterized protein n=1 Tax=Parnassius mnemosyne TaxID=213953 RepID=A0AAV1LKE8_9NEOP
MLKSDQCYIVGTGLGTTQSTIHDHFTRYSPFSVVQTPCSYLSIIWCTNALGKLYSLTTRGAHDTVWTKAACTFDFRHEIFLRNSQPGTIRGDLCGSDSVEAANKEIALWFTEKELVG